MSTPPSLRPDLVALSGYHSPQVPAEVRLNTNESPFPPPESWRGDVGAALERIDFNRYPDRQVTELRGQLAAAYGVAADELFCANGSDEILQCLLLAFGGPGRRALVFEPTYKLHSQIARVTGTEVVVAEREADFTIDPAVARRAIDEAQPEIVFLCSPNNPTGRAEPLALVREVVDAAPGLVVVDEAYGQFSPRSALELRAEPGLASRGLAIVRTFSKTWAMAASRLGYVIADPTVIAGCEAVVLPYHLSAPTQVSGIVALRYRAEMEARVAVVAEERGRAGRRASRAAGRQLAVGRQLRALPAAPAGGQGGLAGAARPRRPHPGLLRLGPPRGVPAGHGRHAEGERPVPAGAGGGSAMTDDGRERGDVRERKAERRRATKETTIAVSLDVDGTGTVSVSTGLPFFDHMVEQLGRHGGFDLSVEATGDLHVDAHHTVEDVGIVVGQCLAEALGDKAGVRRFASLSLPLDEALVDVALDLSGRPYLAYDVPFAPDTAGLGSPPFDPQLAEEFWRAFATAAALTLHVRMRTGKNTHHIVEASFKGVARALRDAVRVEGVGIPSTKGAL